MFQKGHGEHPHDHASKLGLEIMNVMDNKLGRHNYVLDEKIIHADGKNEQRRSDRKDVCDPDELDGPLRVFAA
jgi:hypothetical protein